MSSVCGKSRQKTKLIRRFIMLIIVIRVIIIAYIIKFAVTIYSFIYLYDV